MPNYSKKTSSIPSLFKLLLALAAIGAAASSKDGIRIVNIFHYPVDSDGPIGPGIARQVTFGAGVTYQHTDGSMVYYEDSNGLREEALLGHRVEVSKPEGAIAPGVPVVCHPYDCFTRPCKDDEVEVQIGPSLCHETLTTFGQGAVATVCNMTGPGDISCLSTHKTYEVNLMRPEL